MLGTPAIGMGGLAPNKPVAKAIMLTSWQHHMDSVAERAKAAAQGAIKAMGSNPTAVIPTHQTDRCRWSQATPPFFFLLLDMFKESPSRRNLERSGAVLSGLGS